MKLKTLIVLAVIGVMFRWPAVAQTNDTNNAVAQAKPAQFKTVLETNWTFPTTDYRVVGGQLYNIRYSKLWGDPREAAGLSVGDWMWMGYAIRYAIKVNQVRDDKIICAIFRQRYQPETYTGVLQMVDKEFFEDIVIYHYPNAKSLVSGQDLGDCRCMRVTNYISNGVSLIALDCGVQYTNLVPVIKAVKVKVNP
jgi:hypothetical protein